MKSINTFAFQRGMTVIFSLLAKRLSNKGDAINTHLMQDFYAAQAALQ